MPTASFEIFHILQIIFSKLAVKSEGKCDAGNHIALFLSNQGKGQDFSLFTFYEHEKYYER